MKRTTLAACLLLAASPALADACADEKSAYDQTVEKYSSFVVTAERMSDLIAYINATPRYVANDSDLATVAGFKKEAAEMATALNSFIEYAGAGMRARCEWKPRAQALELAQKMRDLIKPMTEAANRVPVAKTKMR